MNVDIGFCLRGSSNDQTIAQRRYRSFELVDVPGEIKHHSQLEDAFWDSAAFARLSFRNFCQQALQQNHQTCSSGIDYASFAQDLQLRRRDRKIGGEGQSLA